MREKLYSLKKARIRQSWNKYNLYNLMRQRPLRIEGRTYFQQKYAAKQETRRYHGEHLTKRQWQNIFRHSLHSVVPMNARVLAGSDGSEQAMGRGAGLDLLSPGSSRRGGSGVGVPQSQQTVQRVPYMNQMWAPMERRLDIAVFRALFASSARQARQFVVHGFVNVNGKKMIHPGYMLNPGDMFSVDPEQVLFATGKPKDYLEKQAKLKKIIQEQKKAAGVNTESEKGNKSESESSSSESDSESESDSDSDSDTESSPAKKTTSTETIVIPGAVQDLAGTSTATNSDEKDSPSPKQDPSNPLDPTKPYLTPWEPRDYLSPFAFIPRYLEVNFNICHAVYLRHPVARPGASEVASPFGPETQQLAFHWFLRRR